MCLENAQIASFGVKIKRTTPGPMGSERSSEFFISEAEIQPSIALVNRFNRFLSML